MVAAINATVQSLTPTHSSPKTGDPQLWQRGQSNSTQRPDCCKTKKRNGIVIFPVPVSLPYTVTPGCLYPHCMAAAKPLSLDRAPNCPDLSLCTGTDTSQRLAGSPSVCLLPFPAHVHRLRRQLFAQVSKQMWAKGTPAQRWNITSAAQP